MSAARYIFEKIGSYGDAVAQIDAETGKNMTFNGIRKKSAALTQWLQRQNLGKNDIIGFISRNNTDFVWIMLGIIDSGASCYLINPQYTLREILHALSLATVKGLVLQKGVFKTICCPPMTEIKFVVEFGTSEVEFSEGVIPMDDIFDGAGETVRGGCFSKLNGEADSVGENGFGNAGPMAEDDERRRKELEEIENIPEDLALVLNSSGSSGLPKGVMITHDNIISALKLSKTFIEKGETAVGLMPFFHAYGLVLMLMCLCEGATVVNISRFSLPFWIRTIKEYSVSYLHIVPSLLVTLVKSNSIDFRDLISVNHVWTGAAPISEKEQQNLRNKFHQPITLHHSYGLTETTFTVFTGVSTPKKPGSPGKLIDSMECKIVDAENNILKTGQVGEVYFKGPLVMKGYINNPKATGATIDIEGWLRTGDLGYFDEDGYFYFVDRIKEIVKYQGYQVSTCELEFVLISHPNIKDAAVIAAEHELFGQVPRAFVVLHKESNDAAQEIHEYMREMVAPFKLLRGGLVFVDSIPKTASGKNQRNSLRSRSPDTILYDQKMKSR